MNQPNLIQSLDTGVVVRLAMMMTHYRHPINWTNERMLAAQKQLQRWYNVAVPCDDQPPKEFMTFMLDDMNTPGAIAVMNKLAKEKRGRELYAAMRLLEFVK